MDLVTELNPEYPPIAEIASAINTLYERHKAEYREQVDAQGFEWNDEKGNDPWKGLFNYNRAEYRDADGVLGRVRKPSDVLRFAAWNRVT